MSNVTRNLTAVPPPFEAHSWWLEVSKTVSVSECADLFSVDQRTIYRWRADGRSAARSVSVMEHFRTLLAMLIMFDRVDLVITGVEYFNSILRDVADEVCVMPLAPTIHEEITRDFVSVARLSAAIENKEPVAVVRSWAQAASEEISRTVAKYEQES